MPIQHATAQGNHWVNINTQAERFPSNGYGGSTGVLASSHVLGVPSIIVAIQQTVAVASSHLEITDGDGNVLFTFQNNGNFLGVPRSLGNPGVIIPFEAISTSLSWGAQIGATVGSGYMIEYRRLRP